MPLGSDYDLTEAAASGNLEVVERLIKTGCTLKAGESCIWSPLQMAIGAEKWTIAEMLIEAGAELNKSADNEMDMPFMLAVTYENVAFIKLMIQHGADVNISDGDDATPLLESLDLFHFRSRSCDCGNSEVVQTLLSAGANVNVIDNFGRTPLGKAAYIGAFEAVVKLVRAGADLNRPSSQNSAKYMRWTETWADTLNYRSPLAWAAINGHEDVVRFLFESGAEWRSLQKEPAVFYTHRLLLESCFPDVSDDGRNESFDPKSSKTTPVLANDREDSANIDHDESPKRHIVTIITSKARCLLHWVQALYDRLQLIRLEALALTSISLLLVAREGIRHFSVPQLGNVKFMILALVTGIFLASWMYQSAT